MDGLQDSWSDLWSLVSNVVIAARPRHHVQAQPLPGLAGAVPVLEGWEGESCERLSSLHRLVPSTRNLPTGTRSEHWAMDLLIRLNISLSSLRSAYTTVSLSVNVDISLQFYNLTVLYLSISWGGSFQFSAKTSKIYIFSLTVINMNIHSVSSITSLKNFDFHANRSISTLALSMQRFVQVKDAVHVPLDY